ncbi:Serine/threonine-protein kinase WNK (With No Lysine)-related [Striga hermonthica]|uniref:Serine/threonine-protein kinase WNK (With No Lysine)-related n=1 Tax=Striga hermonthica TaxID=68872 RepID=A0A9N7RQN7_STRHE|nr:Serine/threonine-protein kinase WNK (With No Lysine)-related [Striga hermonthica]
MENGLPMLNCLLQHTLRSLCSQSSNSSNPSKWVYAVFWRILPRNYPPPKWDHGGSLLDRAKGNKRNWILVWEDGFCDFCECEREGRKCSGTRFGADIFFKMAHEVYNFGEGVVGKVAADNGHKWVYKDSPKEVDLSFISSWNMSIDPQPRAWEAQFSSGIETIAIISVKEGAVQLGSFDKVGEDINMVTSIQRKLSYIQSLPGIHAIQRPYQPIQDSIFLDYNNSQRLIVQTNEFDDRKYHMIGSIGQNYEIPSNGLPTSKSIFLGYNLLHSSGNLGAPFTKTPFVQVPHCGPEGVVNILQNNNNLKGEEYDAAFDDISAFDVKVRILASMPNDRLLQDEKHNQDSVARHETMFIGSVVVGGTRFFTSTFQSSLTALSRGSFSIRWQQSSPSSTIRRCRMIDAWLWSRPVCAVRPPLGGNITRTRGASLENRKLRLGRSFRST